MNENDEKKNSTFTTLGSDESSTICGPDGCSIEEHRNLEKKKNHQEDQK